MTLAIDEARLIARLDELGATGRDEAGRLCRLAASDADRAGRDLLCRWLGEAGLRIEIDRIGNIFGLWEPEGVTGAPLMIGSHIDTVIDAGIYDGCLGVIAGLAVIEAMQTAGLRPSRPVAVAAFTNEEGVRYAPDMLGSLVMAGGLATADALATVGTDGTTLGAELERIGYAGRHEPGFLKPHAFIELHVEQGPVLEAEGIRIGAVENLQGISWQKVTITGTANHAGTTPMTMRRDAGVAAARVVTWLDALARETEGAVATVGTMQFEPDAINVIPSKAVFTVDMRNPDEALLRAQEAALEAYLADLRAEGFAVGTERLARFEPVTFAAGIVTAIEEAAVERQLSSRRMTSGAGHDAQMIARIAPAAMIFVPSRDGISHNPAEFTARTDLVAGANVLLDVAWKLSRQRAKKSIMRPVRLENATIFEEVHSVMKRVSRFLCSVMLLLALVVSASGLVHATGAHESHMVAMTMPAEAHEHGESHGHDGHGAHHAGDMERQPAEGGHGPVPDFMSCCAAMAGACSGLVGLLPLTTVREPSTSAAASYVAADARLSGIAPDCALRPPRA